MDHTKVTTRENVFQSEFLTLDKVTLELPNKKIKTHYNVTRVPTISILPIAKDGDVYLISEYRYLLGKVALGTVAGTIDKDEEPLVAAKRELLEEAGITARKWKELGTVDLAASYIKGEVSLFVAEDLEIGKATPEEDEHISLIKMPMKEAFTKVLNGEITTASSIMTILMAWNLRNK